MLGEPFCRLGFVGKNKNFFEIAVLAIGVGHGVVCLLWFLFTGLFSTIACMIYISEMHIQYQCEFESATLVLHKHKSTLLEDNSLGDSVLRYSPVLIPKENPGNLPLVALLVGFTGSGLKVISQSLWKKNLPERIAQLLAQKQV